MLLIDHAIHWKSLSHLIPSFRSALCVPFHLTLFASVFSVQSLSRMICSVMNRFKCLIFVPTSSLKSIAPVGPRKLNWYHSCLQSNQALSYCCFWLIFPTISLFTVFVMMDISDTCSQLITKAIFTMNMLSNLSFCSF